MERYIKKYLNERKQVMKDDVQYSQKIMELRNEIKSLEIKKAAIEKPNWIESIVRPLAYRLSGDLYLDFEISEPKGIDSRTTIYLVEDETRGIAYSFTLVAKDLYNGQIYYETGQKTDEYRPGTVGYANGMNNVDKPLPGYEEILDIVKGH